MMRITVLMVALCLCGCAADRALRDSPNFRSGYDDGCAAASTVGANPRETPHRDEDSYKNDHAYHAGWSSGFSTCRNQNAGSAAGAPSISAIPGLR